MLTKEELEKLALLSNIYMSEEEVPEFLDELQKMIKFADQVTEGVERFSAKDNGQVSMSDQGTFVSREDEVIESASFESVLGNAKNTEAGYFLVRKKV